VREVLLNAKFWNFVITTIFVVLGFILARQIGENAAPAGGLATGLISAISWGGSTTDFPAKSSNGWNVVAAITAAMTLGFTY
jgi:hypothetical protein